jgi:hypothetical protein
LQVYLEDSKVFLKDLNSTNGTKCERYTEKFAMIAITFTSIMIIRELFAAHVAYHFCQQRQSRERRQSRIEKRVEVHYRGN